MTINLTQILSHLPQNKIQELSAITQAIVDTKQAHFIILYYGSYARGNYREIPGQIRGKRSDYDILLVIKNAAQRSNIKSQLEQTFKNSDPSVQLIIETLELVNTCLAEEDYFFLDIKREGKILYDSKQFKLTGSLGRTPTQIREKAEKEFKAWFNKANEFFVGSQDSLKREFVGKAAFELQQAVEMCYTAIELVFTNYKPREHMLVTLKNRVALLDDRILSALPRETQEQKELFDHLDFAYIAGRYLGQDEFPVTQTQLNYWHQETQKNPKPHPNNLPRQNKNLHPKRKIITTPSNKQAPHPQQPALQNPHSLQYPSPPIAQKTATQSNASHAH